MAPGGDTPNRSGDSELLAGRPWWLASTVVLLIGLGATTPTAGDIGLTWDEPAYRYSQMVSAEWWRQLVMRP